MHFIITTFVLLFTFSYFANSANILGIFHFPSPSHHMLGSKILKELAKRGHNVTMLSPFPLKEPMANYTDISMDHLVRRGEEFTSTIVKDMNDTNDKDKMPFYIKTYLDTNDAALGHKKVQKLLTDEIKFDLVIYDSPTADLLLGIAYKLNAPAILFSPFGDISMYNQYSGNYYPLSYLPVSDSIDVTTFMGRVMNVIKVLKMEINDKNKMYKLINQLHHKHFPDAPSLRQLLDNVALLLWNSHFTYEMPRPYTPNIIQIGGFNLVDHKEIQDDLKQWLDKADDGVILVSYGSKIKGFAFDSKKVNLFLSVFSKFKQQVLWKFDVNEIKNMIDIKEIPSNVRFESWIPQKEVLNHPNIKAFITHGGMGGITEAIYGGVPMIGTPFYGDQIINVKNMVRNYGYGVELKFFSMTESLLEDAIKELLNNPKYTQNIKKASMAFKKQPISPLDKAIFWIEHVIKYKGADHLKPASLKLSSYQHQILDVITFLVILTSLMTITLYYVISKLIKFLFKRK